MMKKAVLFFACAVTPGESNSHTGGEKANPNRKATDRKQ